MFGKDILFELGLGLVGYEPREQAGNIRDKESLGDNGPGERWKLPTDVPRLCPTERSVACGPVAIRRETSRFNEKSRRG